MKLLYALILIFSFSSNAYDLEQITIKTNKIKNLSGVVIFQERELEKYSTFDDLIAGQSDLALIRSGGMGQMASLFIRGNDSANVMVIMDGVILNDPSNPNGQFDFGKISLNNIGKVEILKGPQTLFYGPNALGGVLILTSKADQVNKTNLSLKAASFDTYETAINQTLKHANGNISLGGNFLSSQGISAAKDISKATNDKDHVEQINTHLNIVQNLNEKHSLKFNHLYSQNKNDIDKGSHIDDPNDYQTQKQHALLIAHHYDSPKYSSDLSYSLFKIKRELFILEDDNDSQDLYYKNEVSAQKFKFNNLYLSNDILTHQINFEHGIESDKEHHYSRTSALIYAQQFNWDLFLFNWGARLDSHNLYKEKATYQIGMEKRFDKFNLKLNHATGIKAPTLSQLYAPVYGNKNLIPEKSISTDLNADYFIHKNLIINTSFFHSLIKDRLTYEPSTYVSINDGEATISGVEVKSTLKIKENFIFTFSNTALKTEDRKNKEKLLRRPHFSSRFISEYQREKLTMQLETSYISKRDDIDQNMQRIKMPSYALLDLSLSYAFSSEIRSLLKINNLLDKNYEALSGFNSPKRFYSFEMNFNF